MISSAVDFLNKTDRHLTVVTPELPTIPEGADDAAEVVSPAYSSLGVYIPLREAEEGTWGRPAGDNSLPEVYGTINIARGADVPFWKTWSAFLGPGAMIAVGEMHVLLARMCHFPRSNHQTMFPLI